MFLIQRRHFCFLQAHLIRVLPLGSKEARPGLAAGVEPGQAVCERDYMCVYEFEN